MNPTTQMPGRGRVGRSRRAEAAATSIFGALISVHAGEIDPRDIGKELNQMASKWGYDHGLSAEQIAETRGLLTDALVTISVAMTFDACERPEQFGGSSEPHRLPLCIFGSGEYATEIGGGA